MALEMLGCDTDEPDYDVDVLLLYDAGVYVNPVLPPATPASECLLRTSYMATLKEPLLDEAMDIMASVLTEEAK